MKKLALILNTRYSVGTLLGIIFFGLGLLLIVLGAVFPRAAMPLFAQGGAFCAIGILAMQLFSVDQLFSCLLLPITAQDFVAAKTMQILITSSIGCLVLAAGLLASAQYAQVPVTTSLIFTPALIFPLMCTFSLLSVALFLSGNSFMLIIIWIVMCAIPGFLGGILQAGIAEIIHTTNTIMQQYPVMLILTGIYLICLVLCILLYLLSLHNFNKLQFNRFMQIDKGKGDFRSL